MAGAGEHAGAIGAKAEDEAGGEAAVHMANEPPVQPRQKLCRIAGRFGQSPQGANDQRDGHGGLQSLAADVADDDQGLAIGQRDDLEEVAANHLSGEVGAGNLVAGNDGRRLWHENLLQSLRVAVLLVE